MAKQKLHLEADIKEPLQAERDAAPSEFQITAPSLETEAGEKAGQPQPETLPAGEADGPASKAQKNAEKAAARQAKREQRRAAKIRRRQEKAELKQQRLLTAKEREVRKSCDTAYKIKQIAKLQPTHKADWFRLDNAALIYPALARDSNALFRISAYMKEPVDPVVLQQALNDIVLRFPTITSSLKAGLFWWYLDAPTTPLIIEEQQSFPCRPLRLDHRRSMIRVTYFNTEIAIEFFHSATDGAGGQQFLNCLIAAYLTRKGVEITDRTNCPHHLDRPRFEEMQDAFQCVKTKEKLPPPEKVKAMHMKGRPLPQNGLSYYKFICDADSLKAAAKGQGASITQFLSAAILQSIHLQAEDTLYKYRKPIRLSVPINLRAIYGKQTLRNFSSYFYVQYTGGTFAELIKSVKSQFEQKATREYVQSNINYNTSQQASPVIRAVPLSFKYPVLKAVYHHLGYSQNSASFSNLGVIAAPKEFAEHIARYDVGVGRTFCEPVGVSSVSYNGITAITCSSVIADTQFERHLLKCLTDNGVILALESTEGVTE